MSDKLLNIKDEASPSNSQSAVNKTRKSCQYCRLNGKKSEGLQNENKNREGMQNLSEVM